MSAQRQERETSGGILRHGQQVIPIHAFVLSNLVVWANPARVDHDPPLGVCLWVEQVIAL